MFIKNLKIGTQLILSFGIVMFFVVSLGIISFIQTTQLSKQVEDLYKHPFQVRDAAGEIISDIEKTQIAVRDMLIFNDDNEQFIINEALVATAFIDIDDQLDVIKAMYLGPASDVEVLVTDYNNWQASIDNRIDNIRAGNLNEVKDSLGDAGYVGIYRLKLTASAETIHKYAQNKANQLYTEYINLYNTLNYQLTGLIILIIIASSLISIVLIRNIRKPLKELGGVINRFQVGDMNARSTYQLNNEFGVLASAFNKMAKSIESSNILTEKSARLSSVMLSQEDAKHFFQTVLALLMKDTGAQLAAVYLLNKNKKTFDHFCSIGLDDEARKAFSVDNLEGEFGNVMLTHKLQYLKKIPEDTTFKFNTINGTFIPREIITIPILAGNELHAIITMACLDSFQEQALDFINSILVSMSARIEGILAYRAIKEFKETLEQQNRELDAQKNELSIQTTELTRQNIELDMQKEQLAEASRLKTHFLSNMSHELRTPLNSVIALSGVLNRRLLNKIPDEEYSYLEIIERNGKNLLELINDILDISRIEAGREEINLSDFNVDYLLTDLIALIEPQAIQKNIALIRATDIKELRLVSDEDKLRHVLQNIIGNAVKFTDKGKVEVSVNELENEVEITVSDTGIGISDQQLPHIFDEFRQGDSGTARRYGGTGLGLAIAKKYMEMLGGNISVKSKIGEGSNFKVIIPKKFHDETIPVNDVSFSEKSHMIDEIDEDQKKKLEGKTILIIEDSDPAIIQITDLLHESGIEVISAHGATEAFIKIDQKKPDVIILDLMIPDIDGFAILKILRENESTIDIPVLILTAKHITKEELSFLQRNHVAQLIQKGDVNHAKFLGAIIGMFDHKEDQQESKKVTVKSSVKKPTILVVEDNPDNMITVEALLIDKFIVLKAHDGETGVIKALKDLPDLILMDIQLPGMNGIEAFKAIRKATDTKIPVIALTASTMPQERESILAYGFDAFVAKPIIADQLWQIIDEVLYGR